MVTDPRTGAILAMCSKPAFDPNPIATHDFNAANAARDALLANPRKPLLMNAYQERYMPGFDVQDHHRDRRRSRAASTT